MTTRSYVGLVVLLLMRLPLDSDRFG